MHAVRSTNPAARGLAADELLLPRLPDMSVNLKACSSQWQHAVTVNKKAEPMIDLHAQQGKIVRYTAVRACVWITVLLFWSQSAPAWADNTAVAKAGACKQTTAAWQHMGTTELTLTFDAKPRILSANVADEPTERAAGYQWLCEDSVNNTAALFVFENTIHHAFHMRNVFVPLVIAFFDSHGEKVDTLFMAPEPPGHNKRGQYYRPSKPYRYALEVPESNPASAWLHAPDLMLSFAGIGK